MDDLFWTLLFIFSSMAFVIGVSAGALLMSVRNLRREAAFLADLMRVRS